MAGSPRRSSRCRRANRTAITTAVNGSPISTCRDRRSSCRLKNLKFQPGSTSLGGGRWYPTLVTLHSGQVWAVGGHPDISDTFEGRHNNNTPEYYSPSTDDWTLTTAARTSPGGVNTDSYPRFHLLPDGTLIGDTDRPRRRQSPLRSLCGHMDRRAVQYTQQLGWRLLRFRQLGDLGAAATRCRPTTRRASCLPTARSPSSCNVEGKSFAATSARQGSAAGKQRNPWLCRPAPDRCSAHHRRRQLSPASDACRTRTSLAVCTKLEIYDPGGFGNPEGWTTLPAGEQSSVLRGYHSVALLLPDAGSGPVVPPRARPRSRAQRRSINPAPPSIAPRSSRRAT